MLNLQTGTAVSNQNCDKAPPENCLMFSPDSQSVNSKVFTITTPRQFKAFGLAPTEALELEMIYDVAGNNEIQQVIVGGTPIRLAHPSNYIILSVPGTYRWHFTGELGALTFACEDVDCCAAQLARSQHNDRGL